ncbi:craniofacial development protein 2-like [Papaver somniferum]|uniref:craniofacial development protein 2-like n=1 Tax=Papaver somniferum TaxID=3469 RepID=UPI000E6F5325|nr:craniofacial development protein 2-like [Papaver somniferum]
MQTFDLYCIIRSTSPHAPDPDCLCPQERAPKDEKTSFWEDLEGLVRSVPLKEKLFVGGDLNGHVGSDCAPGEERVHRRLGDGTRNHPDETIMDFAVSADLAVTNTFFTKRQDQLATYVSGGNSTQIDFILCRREDLKYCLDCKTIPGAGFGFIHQHKLLVAVFRLKGKPPGVTAKESTE